MSSEYLYLIIAILNSTTVYNKHNKLQIPDNLEFGAYNLFVIWILLFNIFKLIFLIFPISKNR